MKTTEPKMKTETITPIETAIEALEDLIHHIQTDIIGEYESSKNDPENGVDGWNPSDDVSEFLKSLGDDGFKANLVGLAMCLYKQR